MSFDAHPTVYWLVGIVLMAINLAMIAIPFRPFRCFLQICTGIVLLVWMRLPAIIFNQELNPDESQVIGHALTLAYDPIYWRSVDGTTIGPLDIYPLTILGQLGLGFDYTAARIFGLLCVMGSLWFFRKSIANFYSESVAQVGWLAPLFLLAFTQEVDFVHYSSEQVPLLLLSMALYIVSVIQSLSPFSHSAFRWFLGLGLLLGMVPFAKLQGVPQAAFLGLWGVVLAFQQNGSLKNLIALMAGAVVFPVLTLGWVIANDLLPEFMDFYIKGNLIYAGGTNTSGIWGQFTLLLNQSKDMTLYLVSVGVLGMMGLIINQKRLSSVFSMTFWGSFLYLLASIYAATKSGNVFLHYLNFCIYPLAFLGVSFWTKNDLRLPQALLTSALVALPFGTTILYKILTHQPLNQYISTQGRSVTQSPVAQLIQQHARADEKLVVWGWMGKYHVETQMPQGAAESHFERCIYPHPMRERYYKRFLADMRRNHPKVFVDAVGPNSLWVNDRTTQAHEHFPELKQLIQTNYTFVGEVEHTRVYVRNE